MKIGCFGTRNEFLSNVVSENIGLEPILIDDQEDMPKYDIVLTSGVYHRIPDRLLGNVYGFHESDLPFGHGCAPLAWTLVLDLEFLTVTMFKLDKDFDTGNIVNKSFHKLYGYDNIHSLEFCRDGLIMDLIIRNLKDLDKNKLNIQDGRKVYFPKRYPSHSVICKELTNKPLGLVWRTHIRACHNEKYPCNYRSSELYYSVGKTENHVATRSKFVDLTFPCSFTVDGRDITLSRKHEKR